MVPKRNSQNYNFQYYVDTVKRKKIPWNVFVNFMEDLSFSDVNRLKYLNAILLTEVTVSYSDIERLKYLSVILMAKFKDFIQVEDDDEFSKNENLEDDLNDQTCNEISREGEIQISSINENESKGNFVSPIHTAKDFIQIEDDVEDSENELNDETINRISDNEIQISGVSENERQETFDSLPIQIFKGEHENVDYNNQTINDIFSQDGKQISVRENERQDDFDSQINEENKWEFRD